jgi:thiaminase
LLECTAYSRYILDVGQSEDWLALQVALAPCLIGYGAIAQRLYTEEKTLRDGNRYWKWIENYVAEDYTEAVRLGSGKFFSAKRLNFSLLTVFQNF